MIARLWIIFQIFIIGCVTIEICVFLRKLDENLTSIISNPHANKTSQLLQDVSAYSFNVGRLLRLFQLKREHVMEAAKWLHSMEHPLFMRNFSFEQVKSDFQLNNRDSSTLSSIIEKITKNLNAFNKACEENPGFISVTTPKPNFALENYAHLVETMFNQPDPNMPIYKLIKAVEDYYYFLGKFTKKFSLGRTSVMDRAKELFESGGPTFLKYYDYHKMRHSYRLSTSEAASLHNLIYKIRRRYEQFTGSCFKNPSFQSKIDFSSIQKVRNCEIALKYILLNPAATRVEELFKQLRHYYHLLGYLRRYNNPHRSELLKALFEMFDSSGPIILRSIDLEKIKQDFKLDEETALKLSENIGHLRRRFNKVQDTYRNVTSSYLLN